MVRRRPRWFVLALGALAAVGATWQVWKNTSGVGWGRQLFLHEMTVEVLEIEDGTSLIVRAETGLAAQFNGRFRVRLLGIARSRPRTLDGFDRAQRAMDWTQQFVAAAPQRRLRLEFDRQRFDATETPLAFVLRGDDCLNEQLLAAGWVVLAEPPGLPSKRMRSLIQAAQAHAQGTDALWTRAEPKHTVE